MKKSKIIAFLTVCGLTFSAVPNGICAEEPSPTMYYVATNGKEDATGTIDDPFASFERAQSAVRKLNETGSYPEGGVVINFRAGVYRITDTVNMNELDSGKEGAPVVYRGYMNEKVKITAAAEITARLTEVTDSAVKSILVPEVADKIKQIDLSEAPELMAVDRSKRRDDRYENELIINDEIMNTARYPDNNDYISCQLTGWQTPDISQIKNAVGGVDTYAGGNLQNQFEYDFQNAQITESEIIFSGKTLTPNLARPQCKLFNSPAFISVPGECYIDRTKKVAYVYPREDTIESVEVSSGTGAMFNIKNMKFVEFRNLQITGGVSNMIYAEKLEGFVIDNCYINNFPFRAYFAGDTKNCTLKNSHFYNLGRGCFTTSGGDVENLEPSGFKFHNNEVNKLGRAYPYQSDAVYFWDSVGPTVSYNKIYDCDSHAVSGSLLMATIEHNEIFDTNHTGEDQAIMYYGYDFFRQTGPVIRYNYLHDNLNTVHVTGHGSHGIYSDGGTQSEIYGNIIANVSDSGYTGVGVLNKIYNNIFVGRKDGKSVNTVVISAGMGGSHYYHEGKMVDWTTEFLETDPRIKLPSYTYKSEAWRKAFPDYVAQLESGRPYYGPTEVYNNLIYNYGDIKIWEDAIDHPKNRIENNYSTTKDPGFVDPDNGNYSLKSDSVVFKKIKGFQNIDMSKIGLATDMATKKLDGGIALKINSPLAIKGSETVMVDKDNAEVIPTIIDGRTLMPVRFVSESMGAKVDWNADTREVTITSGDKTIKLALDNTALNVNGAETQMDVPAQIIEGRTFIPLRAIAEALGKKVFWDPKGLVVINDKDSFNSENDSVEIDVLLDKMNQF